VPEILIRTDASRQTGLGHAVRCLALAQMLKEQAAIAFYAMEMPDRIASEIKQNGFGFKKIENETDFLESLTAGDIVVLDGYGFDTTYQEEIKSHGVKLVCIDDIHTQPFAADIIINPNIGIDPKDYSATPFTRFALGPDYALLRPAFLKPATEHKTAAPAGTVLICFGGSDYKDLTGSTLRTILSFPEFTKVTVVVGDSYDRIEELEIVCRSDKRVVYHHAVGDEIMAKLLRENETAIVPASGILTEALAVGNQVISGMYADNQKLVYSNYKEREAFIDAGDFSGPALEEAVAKSLTATFIKKRIVDGKSGERIRKLFSDLALSCSIVMRKAELSDTDITYSWASNDAIRAFSFSREAIAEETHRAWFSKRLESEQCIYLIASIDQKSIGSVRFDIDGENIIISYLLDKGWHGKGIGQWMLLNGMQFFCNTGKNKFPGANRFVGYVMEENIPSVKIFERLGFDRVIEDNKLKFQLQVN
jgi:UDP-2,4-diacetamido-2,4,6-trideoxy-beta-L-altropyranose hydrolase